MNRVIAYVDGFNLYFGLRAKGWRRYYWLDLPALATKFLLPQQELQATHYFTARIRNDGQNSKDAQRQSHYIDALRAKEVQIHEGHYLEKVRQCRKCGSQWRDYEEKMTDVNIAVQLLGDAYENRFDTAFVISGDSDLTTPIQRVCSRFADKKVIVLFPPDRSSKQLKNAATAYLAISEAKLRQSQLDETVRTVTGHVLRRPEHWT